MTEIEKEFDKLDEERRIRAPSRELSEEEFEKLGKELEKAMLEEFPDASRIIDVFIGREQYDYIRQQFTRRKESIYFYPERVLELLESHGENGLQEIMEREVKKRKYLEKLEKWSHILDTYYFLPSFS